ncbi:MAG: AAA family ATPase, partial [Elusimicrobia bacterium]|nr:AAA family ATPase [Elusimicrobiota bacterium]
MAAKYHRKIPLDKLKKHLALPNPPLQVLLGPRQTGKTTAIGTFIKSWEGPSFYHTADLISPPDAAWLEDKWKQARKKIQRGKRTLLVFDEVQ